MPDTHYGGLIWTKHSLQRLSERGISQEWAWQAYKHPDRKQPGKQYGTTEFISKFDDVFITIVVRKTDKNELLVVSCWADPPFKGTKDWYKKRNYEKYRKAGFWGKIGWQMLRQLGVVDF